MMCIYVRIIVMSGADIIIIVGEGVHASPPALVVPIYNVYFIGLTLSKFAGCWNLVRYSVCILNKYRYSTLYYLKSRSLFRDIHWCRFHCSYLVLTLIFSSTYNWLLDNLQITDNLRWSAIIIDSQNIRLDHRSNISKAIRIYIDTLQNSAG